MLDLYVPEDSLGPGNPFPVIMYVHGGAFKFGSKESDLKPLRYFECGYALAAINYRRSGEAIFPAMIEDCKSAIRFLKTPEISIQYNLDRDRVLVWGESAGGHAVAMLGTTSSPIPRGRFDIGDHLGETSHVIGVVDYYGPTDFLQMDAHVPETSRFVSKEDLVSKPHNAADSPESLYLGQKITEIPDRVREADPCTYIEEMVCKYSEPKAQPRFFIAHGTADSIVPEYMSLLLVEKLKMHNVRHEYLPVEGTDHVFMGIGDEQQVDLDRRTDAFLRKVFGR